MQFKILIVVQVIISLHLQVSGRKKTIVIYKTHKHKKLNIKHTNTRNDCRDVQSTVMLVHV